MIIDRLKVRNYKSLEDVEVPLRPLTVFVGPNNSGKSNIFDCLKFIRDLGLMGPQAVGTRGGFQFVVWGGDLNRAVEIQVDGQMEDGAGRSQHFTYELGIAGILGSPANYLLTKEKFALFGDGEEQKLLERQDSVTKTWSQLEPDKETGSWTGEPRLGIFQFRGSREPRHLALGSFASAVADWGFYTLAPKVMGSPGPARSDLYLLEDGENLASILVTIQSEGRRALSELEHYLKTALPEIQEFVIRVNEAGQAYFAWTERGLPDDFKVPSWSSSDGTREILALLTLRFAAKLRPLVCIEEPENFIHPGLPLALVSDLLGSISNRTQLLVSTQSPFLVDYLSAEDLLIVEKVDGKTQVRRIPETESIKEGIKVLGLGELWYSGAIGGTP